MTMQSINPATGEVLESVPEASPAYVERTWTRRTRRFSSGEASRSGSGRPG